MLLKIPTWILKYIALKSFCIQHFLKSSLKKLAFDTNAHLVPAFSAGCFSCCNAALQCSAPVTSKALAQDPGCCSALGLLSPLQESLLWRALTSCAWKHCLWWHGLKTCLFAIDFAKYFSSEALNCQNWPSLPHPAAIKADSKMNSVDVSGKKVP